MDGLDVLSSAIPLPSPPPRPNASTSAVGGAAIESSSASTAPSSANAAEALSSGNGAAATSSRVPGYQPVRTQAEAGNTKRSSKACLYCRKGKARCDGLSNSWPCRRCRENGVECVFEGISTAELRRREEQKREDEDRELRRLSEGVSAPAATLPTLEARLARLEAELGQLRLASRSQDSRLGRLEEPRERGYSSTTEDEGSDSSPERRPRAKVHQAVKRDSDRFEKFASDAFDLFWEMYAPLAPYIVPTSDRYEEVKDRSPALMHCIVAVASRHSKDTKLVEYNRKQALKLMRETLHSERPVTLDDLKASLVWNAWLGKGTPPGHTVTLALQLDLPRALETLVAAASNPETAAAAFEQLMPACRIWLTLYAQDLWLSLSLARRPLVTIDLSITSARLLLALPALRPVDARLIAQSELVTILGVLGEHFLKTHQQSVEHTVEVVQQTNHHLESWIATWCAWTTTQEDEAGRYILASFSLMLQSARFFANTRGLRDISSSAELAPIHLPFLRNALDAAVRIQGIHSSQKISHSAEMTLISLSVCPFPPSLHEDRC
ncbi:hypothetical protein BCR35DRAFT_64123 [Leucosporidium creatinivorum]|uniref:Zn(2)-C6 fungal-type domain-containing protein n=1 Tax=Leucosporidium creatinivorum TaxID=106004 RepID=A0A1Y2FHQ1_9BASI|nr:hypothetical protein BCR35DRAFT_64123 [Leucosporidium creatinivorum]